MWNEWSDKTKAFTGRIGLVVGFLVLWQVASMREWVDPLFVSTPLEVFGAMPDVWSDPDARSALLITGREFVVAFVVGTTIGIFAGTVIGLSPVLRRAYYGPILFFMSVPKSIFLPIFVLLLGIGVRSASAFGIFSTFFVVTVNMVGGVGLVESRHLRCARSFAAGRWQTFSSVVFPASLPGLFIALWLGIKYSFGAVLIAELFASRGGLGQLIAGYSAQIQTEKVLALTVAFTIVTILVGNAWTAVERRIDWRRKQERALPQTSGSVASQLDVHAQAIPG